MQDIKAYNFIVQKLRTFFLKKDYIEVPVQSRLSILTACEDPFEIKEFMFANEIWPLTQTGQIYLEYDLLRNADIQGVFCISTSYRNEDIFPIFEFESRGDFKALIKLEEELCNYLGFSSIYKVTYKEVLETYKASALGRGHLERLHWDFGDAINLIDFPKDTEPFWNIKSDDDIIYNKSNIILGGLKTIKASEREVFPVKMLSRFKDLYDGRYAGKLHSVFGISRVKKELDSYLSFEFFPRFGGGIGITRLASALKKLEEKQ